MPYVCPANRVRLAVSISLLIAGSVTALAQDSLSGPANTNGPFAHSPWDALDLGNTTPGFPREWRTSPEVSAKVSAEVLRHPLGSKGRRLFNEAMRHAELGEHAAAIRDLHQLLVQVPSAEAYADNLLGMEYLETNRLADAKRSFEEAARLMPKESVNHSNLAVSLAMTGEWDSAEQEVRKALQLDHGNTRAKAILDLLGRHAAVREVQ